MISRKIILMMLIISAFGELLFGMTFFRLPEQEQDGLSRVKISVVNGPYVEMEVGPKLKVLASPFSHDHPQLVEIGTRPFPPMLLKNKDLVHDDKVFWEVNYGLLASQQFFYKALPSSRRAILLILAMGLLTFLMIRPNAWVWLLCLTAMVGLLLLPDYQRRVLWIGENDQMLFGENLEGEFHMSLLGREKRLMSKKVKIDLGEIGGDLREEKGATPTPSTKVMGVIRGSWSEILVIESLR